MKQLWLPDLWKVSLGILGKTPRAESDIDTNVLQDSTDVNSVVLGIDPSPSTYFGNAREIIKESFAGCVSQIRGDHVLADQVELAVYALGTVKSTKCCVDFTPAKSFEMPQIRTSFGSPIYELYCRMVGETVKRQDVLNRDHDRDVRAAWIFFSPIFNQLIHTTTARHFRPRRWLMNGESTFS